jgi:uncharacterized protein
MPNLQGIIRIIREHSEIILILIPIIIFGTIVAIYGFNVEGTETGEVVIGRHGFRVDVADTPLERQQGLSGRESLRANEGMLFVFRKPAIQRFWMKDMLISIDIIWIDGNRVVGFEENVSPQPGVPLAGLTVYKPPSPVDYVLEVPSGTVSRIGVSVGDGVSIRL